MILELYFFIAAQIAQVTGLFGYHWLGNPGNK